MEKQQVRNNEEKVAKCPDCNTPLVVRSSSYIAGVVTTSWYFCPNCKEVK